MTDVKGNHLKLIDFESISLLCLFFRSVHMRLYSMHKREFVAVFMAFFACFGLGIFIGIAGPPITKTTEMKASAIIANTSLAKDKNAMAHGPFTMRTPMMSSYYQQLWVIAQMETDNTDDERFDKSFHVSVAIDGLTEDHKPVSIMNRNNLKNR